MSKTILLAEDSPDDELLFKLVMKKAGVENPVVVVRDGQEAIAYLREGSASANYHESARPEIVCLDLKMPRVNGFEVLAWLRDNPLVRSGLLVVVLSHFGDTKDIRRAYALGANSFLTKPFTEGDLENLIEHFAGYWTRSNPRVRGAAM